MDPLLRHHAFDWVCRLANAHCTGSVSYRRGLRLSVRGRGLPDSAMGPHLILGTNGSLAHAHEPANHRV